MSRTFVAFSLFCVFACTSPPTRRQIRNAPKEREFSGLECVRLCSPLKVQRFLPGHTYDVKTRLVFEGGRHHTLDEFCECGSEYWHE